MDYYFEGKASKNKNNTLAYIFIWLWIYWMGENSLSSKDAVIEIW